MKCRPLRQDRWIDGILNRGLLPDKRIRTLSHKYVKILYGLVVGLLVVASTSHASTKYNHKCDLTFHSYVSPSIAGCVMSATKSGISFQLSGRLVSAEKCFKPAGMVSGQVSMLLELVRGEEIMREKATLFYSDDNGFLTAKLISNAFPEDGLVIGRTKRKSDGKATVIVDNGIIFTIKVKNPITVTLNGDFGLTQLKGRCNGPLVSSKETISPLDNAKAVCTDLGFRLGTEKFGDCVMKLMP